MELTINIPDNIAEIFQEHGEDLARVVLESIAIHAYRAHILTRAEVARLLGFQTTLQVDDFMTKAGVPFPYDFEDYQQDLRTIQGTSLHRHDEGEHSETPSSR